MTIASPGSTSHQAPVVLTEISLNDAPQTTPTTNDHQTIDAVNVNLIPTVPGEATPEYPAPPVSELPSYNEAIRLKKLEANDVPPSYFPVTPPPPSDARIIIDESEV